MIDERPAPAAAPLAALQQLLDRLLAGELTARGSAAGEDPELDQLVGSVNRLAERLSAQQADSHGLELRADELLAVMTTMAGRDYSARATVTEHDSVFDALAVGLNMLADELAGNEEERTRLQEEIIRSQAAVIQELSTPLIPISNDILVMPLVGHVDSARASQIIGRLLEGIAETRCHTVIMDITGVSIVDTQTANALIRAAQAAQLLGTQVMLTGIRPEVAQSLVQLGVDLRSITTWGTLQMGIAAAFRQEASAARTAHGRIG